MVTPAGINDQIALLEKRGVVIDEEALPRAQRFLLDNGFFRAQQYLEHLPSPTSWQELQSIAEGDQRLREYLLLGLARVEVTFRSRFAYFFTGHESATAYLSEGCYREPAEGGRRGSTLTPEGIVDALHSDVERSKEEFARPHTLHHPIELGKAVELMSMGTLSKAYDGLANTAIKTDIAHSFDYEDPALFGAVYRSLTDLRNRCAHHVRLWNTRPRFAPPMKRELMTGHDPTIYDHTPWAWIVSVSDLIDHLDSSTDFSNGLSSLLAQTPGLQDGLTHPG